MAAIAFKKFFSVSVTHDFYASGLSKDFSIAPTAKTSEKIRDQRLMFRPAATGFTMLYRLAAPPATPPFLPIDDGLYTFILTLKNKQEFINITELDISSSNKYAAGKIVRLYNDYSGDPNALVYELLNRILPAKFTYDFTVATPVNVKIKILDALGTTVYTSPLALTPDDTGTGFHVPVDLSQLAPGKFTLQYYNNNLVTLVAEEDVYVDSQLVGKDAFAILDIRLDTTGTEDFDDFLGYDPFETGFDRRTSQWKYFIVNKTGRTVTTAEIFDTRTITVDTGVYGATASTFGTAQSEPDINGWNTVSIISDDPIPFYEQAQPNMKLEINGSSLIDHLPNPARDATSDEKPALVTDPDITQIFVFI